MTAMIKFNKISDMLPPIGVEVLFTGTVIHEDGNEFKGYSVGVFDGEHYEVQANDCRNVANFEIEGWGEI